MVKVDWIDAFGFAAQALFSARMLIQWIMSERSKKVVSPLIYWQLSLLASFLFFVYGWLEADFAIILGQICSYYIYIWNLDTQNYWKKIHFILRYIILLIPPIVLALLLINERDSLALLWTEMPLQLLIFGSIGQVIFSFRFIYQWWYSRKKGKSLLPVGFWVLSLIGSLCIILYGIYRVEESGLVLIIGQTPGLFIYARNLFLAKRNCINNNVSYENTNNR